MEGFEFQVQVCGSDAEDGRGSARLGAANLRRRAVVESRLQLALTVDDMNFAWPRYLKLLEVLVLRREGFLSSTSSSVL